MGLPNVLKDFRSIVVRPVQDPPQILKGINPLYALHIVFSCEDKRRLLSSTREKFVVIKCILQSLRLEDHMKTIGIDQSLCKISSFEIKCLNNIKKIYQHAGKCDKQQNLKDILNDAMVLTP